MDGGPFSAVIAESQEVGHHEVIPETRQYVVSMLNLKMEKHCVVIRVFVQVCVLLSLGVSSLCYDSCELCLLASINLKPVDPVL